MAKTAMIAIERNFIVVFLIRVSKNGLYDHQTGNVQIVSS